jgi:hypothetical protein
LNVIDYIRQAVPHQHPYLNNAPVNNRGYSWSHAVLPWTYISPSTFTMPFSRKSSQKPKGVDASPARRQSTTISMMEEEFGMRGEPPRTGMRFGRCYANGLSSH